MYGTPPPKAASGTFHTAAAMPRLDRLAVLPRLARHATPGRGGTLRTVAHASFGGGATSTERADLSDDARQRCGRALRGQLMRHVLHWWLRCHALPGSARPALRRGHEAWGWHASPHGGSGTLRTISCLPQHWGLSVDQLLENEQTNCATSATHHGIIGSGSTSRPLIAARLARVH